MCYIQSFTVVRNVFMELRAVAANRKSKNMQNYE